MLIRREPAELAEIDQRVFAAVVAPDHYLRRVLAVIDFERLRPHLADAYSPTMGRPAIDPVLMFKILFLCYQYGLSDRQVVERARTDMAFRWFLGLGLHEALPNHTNGTHFRQRIGDQRFGELFQDIVTQAREHGLVKDRLRLKDATHIFADAAELKPLALAAQMRDYLLRAAQPLFPDWVEQQRVVLDNLRQTTAECSDAERLTQRVEFLRAITVQLRAWTAEWPAADADRQRERLRRLLDVADKLLADRADPQAPDRLINAAEPGVRNGWHCEFFLGFLLDLLIDADSEIITAVNVLPGNGPEAADAIVLLQQEEAAQGNDVAGLSIDGAGFNGPVLRELTDPDGLNVEVIVPPPKPAERQTFAPERFPLKVLADGGSEVSCPNGQTTRRRERVEHAYRYTFKPRQCVGCPLREQCMQNPQSKKGRTVIKNDYEAEYAKVRTKVGTPAYAQTRREHPKIERKLGEMARHHGNRHARYRGLLKTLSQSFLTALVVNVKRMVKLLHAKVIAALSAPPVRAELGTM